MKRFNFCRFRDAIGQVNIVVASLALLLPFSCVREETDRQAHTQGGDIMLTEVSVDARLQKPTRTVMDGAMDVAWEPGDCMSIFDAVGGNRKFESSISEVSPSAAFHGQVSAETSDVCALYPYDASASISSGIISTSLKSVQTAVVNSFPSGTNIAAGKADLSCGGGVEMRNALALVRIVISESGVTQVRFRGRDGEKIAGPVSLDCSGDIPFATAGPDATEVVTLKPSSGCFEQGTYFISVIPSAFNSGFWFELDKEDGTSYRLLGMSPVRLERSRSLNFGEVSSARGVPSTYVVPAMDPSVQKPVVCWIDAAANLPFFGNDLKAIMDEAKRLKDTGFTDVVVDVRPTTGDVLYRSSSAPALSRIDVWQGSSYIWCNRTADFDYLQAWIDAGHYVGLRVFASMNTFTGGYLCPYALGAQGMLFDSSVYPPSANAQKKSWATVLNESSGRTNTMDRLDYVSDYGAKFLNPHKAEVRSYILDIIGEIASYDVDGLILDRCRFSDAGMLSDFSEDAKTAFKNYTGTTVSSWPSDVFSAGVTDFQQYSTWDKKFGRDNYKKFLRQQKWMSFRAKSIHDFVESAASRVRSVNPSCMFGVYVGAWYSSYYEMGVNWASPFYDCSTDYNWADSDYHNYGLSDHCDIMFLGCYASASNITGSGEWTMQGFASAGKSKVKWGLSSPPIVIGGPDIGNAVGFSEGGKGSLLYSTIDAIAGGSKANADGYFVFDLCHIRQFGYWENFKSAIAEFRGN